MTALLHMTETMVGRLLVSGAVILLGLQIFICLQTRRQHRKKWIVWLHLLHASVGFLLTVCLLDGIFWPLYPGISYSRIAPVVLALFSLPWGIFAVAELISAALIIFSYRGNLRYAKSHLLPSSIKEAVDLLPAGICFGDQSGAVALTNLKMDQLCREITGGRLTDTDVFWRELCERGIDQNGSKLVKMASGEVQLFAKNNITVDGKAYTQIVSSDMTEQHRITEELSEKNARLRDIQIRMKAYQAQASDVVISQEILAARQLVHDEVGHALLAARYYLEHPENVSEPDLLAMMRQTNAMLLREVEQPDDMEHDRYLDALKMAEAIGVSVEQSGETPKVGAAREILGRAIGECAANTAKHAEGDRIFVTIKMIGDGFSFAVTNNGAPPKEPIIETGGLLHLRRTVEKAGGTMNVSSVPTFRLFITLPNE